MKKYLLILLIISSILFAACGANKDERIKVIDIKEKYKSNDVSNSYSINEEVYVDGNISIKYPVVSGLGNMEAIVNNALYIKMMLMSEYFIEPINPTIDLTYTIKRADNSILSIVYEGYGNDEGLAYSTNFFYTTNIDLNTGTILSLKDLTTIDDKFINTLKNESTINDNYIPNYFNSMTNEVILEKLINSDQQESEVSSYICEDGTIGISIKVIHAMGDHLEYEISK